MTEKQVSPIINNILMVQHLIATENEIIKDYETLLRNTIATLKKEQRKRDELRELHNKLIQVHREHPFAWVEKVEVEQLNKECELSLKINW